MFHNWFTSLIHVAQDVALNHCCKKKGEMQFLSPSGSVCKKNPFCAY